MESRIFHFLRLRRKKEKRKKGAIFITPERCSLFDKNDKHL